jgi:HK97 family phage major capsid protein
MPTITKPKTAAGNPKTQSLAAQKAARDAAAKLAKEGAILISGQQTYRSFTLQRDDANKDERTIPIVFSSEEPGEQWFGREILDHSPGACDLSRLNAGGALLREHNRNNQTGVVVSKSAKIGTDRLGRCVVKFSRSAEGEKEYQDVLDGIRTCVSVGYEIRDMRLESVDSAGVETYRVTSWAPYEVSIVSIPMDYKKSGVGREAQERTGKPITVSIAGHDPEKLMLKKWFVNLDPAGGVAERGQGGGGSATATRGEGEGEGGEGTGTSEEGEGGEGEGQRAAAPIVTAPRRGNIITPEQARQAERTRLKEISALKNRFGGNAEVLRYLQEQEFAENPESLAAINRTVLQKIGEKAKPIKTPELGLTQRELRRFSFIKVIRHTATMRGVSGLDVDAGFEKEISDECARQFRAQGIARTSKGLFVPREILTQRDLVAGTDSAGGFTVATELKAESFIDLLRNAMMVRAMGATVLTGLHGDVDIPRQNGAGTAYWGGEGSSPTESDQSFGQVSMTPKTVGAFTNMTRRLLLQTSLDMEQLVRMDLAKVIGLAIDYAALFGTGSAGQPLGIVNTTGVGSVAIGTNGGAPKYTDLVAMESKVAVANALMGGLGYLTNAKVRGNLKTTEKSATGTVGNFIWSESSEQGFGEVNGYKAGVSNQVPWTLTKGSSSGVCSAIFFANWADLLIGEWGVLDIQADPYALGLSGGLRVRFLQDVDVAVRHPESFCVIQDATTNI